MNLTFAEGGSSFITDNGPTLERWLTFRRREYTAAPMSALYFRCSLPLLPT